MSECSFCLTAEAGIRPLGVTGLQTGALPLWPAPCVWIEDRGLRTWASLMDLPSGLAGTWPRSSQDDEVCSSVPLFADPSFPSRNQIEDIALVAPDKQRRREDHGGQHRAQVESEQRHEK